MGPLVLLGLGISGAWIGHLVAMEPYRPIFATTTLLCLAVAFRSLYIVPPRCASGTLCADARVVARQRRIFWIVTVSALGLLAGC